MYPAQYWRNNKQWCQWIGKQGTVLAATTVYTSSPEYEHYCPYQIALVDFKDQRKLFMVPPHLIVEPDQQVEVVLRKGSQTNTDSIIEYELKVIPISK